MNIEELQIATSKVTKYAVCGRKIKVNISTKLQYYQHYGLANLCCPSSVKPTI